LSGRQCVGGITVDQHLGHGAIEENHHLASTESRLAQALRGDTVLEPEAWTSQATRTRRRSLCRDVRGSRRRR
jgi:hypothetical protein